MCCSKPKKKRKYIKIKKTNAAKNLTTKETKEIGKNEDTKQPSVTVQHNESSFTQILYYDPEQIDK